MFNSAEFDAQLAGADPPCKRRANGGRRREDMTWCDKCRGRRSQCSPCQRADGLLPPLKAKSKWRCAACEGRPAQCKKCAIAQRRETRKLYPGCFDPPVPPPRCACGSTRWDTCPTCTPLETLIKRSKRCRACGTAVDNTLWRNGERHCASCRGAAKAPRTEHVVKDRLFAQFPNLPPPTHSDNQVVGQGCDVSKKRRADLAWVRDDRVVINEIDEHSHRDRVSYTRACELGKVGDAHVGYCSDSGYTLPCFIVKWNPDERDVLPRVGYDARITALGETIERLLTMDVRTLPTATPMVYFMFYHTAGLDVAAALEASGVPVVIVP